MPLYPDLNQASGVARYAEGQDWIELTFKDGRIYRYDAEAPGPRHLAEMRRRARQGRGLLTYVNRFVRDNYARRIR